MKWIIAAAALLPSYALAETAASSSVAAPSADQMTSQPHSCTDFYPSDARDGHLSGTTQLKFAIGTDGDVSGISVAKSSGYPLLDDAAVSCANHWKYKPATHDGVPIAVGWTANIQWNPPESEVRFSCAQFYSGPQVDFSKIDGTTELAITAYRGDVMKVAVTKSSGDASLDGSAVKCAGMMHFVATNTSGDPVVVQTNAKVAWKDVLSRPK